MGAKTLPGRWSAKHSSFLCIQVRASSERKQKVLSEGENHGRVGLACVRVSEAELKRWFLKGKPTVLESTGENSYFAVRVSLGLFHRGDFKPWMKMLQTCKTMP